MLTYAGDELSDNVESLPRDQITLREGETHFGKLRDALTNHFNPQANVGFQKFAFRKLVQTGDIDEFYNELRQHAETCYFNDPDREIKSQLIAGSLSSRVREKGLGTPNLSLADLLQHARTVQLTAEQSKAMQAEESVQHVKLKNPKNRPVLHDQNKNYSSRQCPQICSNCGGSWPHKGGQRNCPTLQKTM